MSPELILTHLFYAICATWLVSYQSSVSYIQTSSESWVNLPILPSPLELSLYLYFLILLIVRQLFYWQVMLPHSAWEIIPSWHGCCIIDFLTQWLLSKTCTRLGSSVYLLREELVRPYFSLRNYSCAVNRCWERDSHIPVTQPLVSLAQEISSMPHSLKEIFGKKSSMGAGKSKRR